jgi:hypothetical protein
MVLKLYQQLFNTDAEPQKGNINIFELLSIGFG